MQNWGDNACAEAYSSAATLSFASTTWNGTSWVGGEPTANKALIISANYTSPGANYNLQGCSLTVQNNAVVTVVPQDSVILSGALTVTTGSTMTFEAQAHLIQSGTTNLNSGTVIVKANSSPIKRLDYTLWSAPVAGQQMQAFSPLTLANRFYNYDSNTNFYTVVTSPSTTSFEAAKAFYELPEYLKAREAREGAAIMRMVAVEGVWTAGFKDPFCF